MRYAFIERHEKRWPTAVQCRVLQVSRSGYYAWRRRVPSAQQKRRKELGVLIERSHADSGGIYGYRKVHADLLHGNKIIVCRETVRLIMRERGLYSVVKRKFVRTTDSAHLQPVAENILDRNFKADAPDRKWVTDISYIRTRQGWVYIAVVLDLFSRMVVGWQLSSNIDTLLVSCALHTAIRTRCPQAGLLHHSDRGVQYAAGDYQDILRINGIVCSMSRKANCWDNAAMESFFGKLKCEWVRGRIFDNIKHVQKELFSYIEVFYNRKRRHVALGYLSPAEFEARNRKPGTE